MEQGFVKWLLGQVQKLKVAAALPTPAEVDACECAASPGTVTVTIVRRRLPPPDVVAFWSPTLGEWVTIKGEPVDLPRGGTCFVAWKLESQVEGPVRSAPPDSST